MTGESYHFEKLDNGINVCLVDVPQAQSVRADFCFKDAGTAASPEGKPEVAHVMEHMLLKGCKKYPTADKFNDALEGNGSERTAATYDDLMQYGVTSPINDYQKALNAFLRAIEAPLLKPSDLITERAVVREELLGYLDQDEYVVWPHIRDQAGYDKETIRESLNTLDTIEPDDLRSHHSRTHVTSALGVTVTANFSEANQADILKLLSGLELPEYSQAPPYRTKQLIPSTNNAIVLDSPSKNSIYYILAKLRLPQVELAQEVAYQIAESQLFDYRDGELTKAARDKGFMYSMEGYRTYDSGGNDLFRINGNVGRKNVVRLFELFKKKFSYLIEDDVISDFEGLRNFSLGRFLLSYESAEKIHERATESFWKFGTVRSIAEARATMESITEEEVRSARHNMFRGGVAVIGARGSNLTEDQEVIDVLTDFKTFLGSY